MTESLITGKGVALHHKLFLLRVRDLAEFLDWHVSKGYTGDGDGSTEGGGVLLYGC